MKRQFAALLRTLLTFALLTQLLPPSTLSAAPRVEEDVTPQARTWQNSRTAPTRAAASNFFADLNGDQRVDGADLELVALAWNCATGDACYAAELDRDSNGRIDATDLAAFGNEYDIEPPLIAITKPADNGVVSGATVRVEGTVTDRHGVSQVLVNGIAAALTGSNFAADIPAAGGPLAVNVAAVDAIGQSSAAGVLTTVDNEGPFINVLSPANRQSVNSTKPTISLSFFDLASAMQTGSLSATLTDRNGGVTNISGQLTVSGNTASGAPAAALQQDQSYTLTVTLQDAAGNVGKVVSSFYVPVDPASITPPSQSETSGWVSGVIYNAATCAGDIEFDPEDCTGLAGAKVTLEKVDTALLQQARQQRRQALAESRSPYGLPDFVDSRAKSAFAAVPGAVVTGPDGFFAFPVADTGTYALRVEKNGFTYGQRMAQIVQERSTPTNDIYLTPMDPAVTQCTSAGCQHTSADGQMELIVPAGAIPSGQTLEIRATEFDQVNFLPSGELPQGTAETYAFNLSGASEFVFAQPVTVRLKNSRGFAPGDVIPLGYWNQSLLQWEDAGIATVSNDGVWLEMQVTHFSNFDPNQPGALSQSVPSVTESTQTNSEKCATGDCTSNIAVQGGVLGQTVDLPTVVVLDDPFGLTFSYDSGRANPSEVIDIEIGMERLDPGTELQDFVQAELFIEGEKTAQFTFPLDPAVQTGDEVGRFRILWDGRDSQGRKLPPGVYRYAVKVRLNFRAQFFRSPSFGAPPDFTKPTGVFRNSSTDTFLFGSVLLKGDADNFFGAGWYLEGQQRLFDAQNGDVLVIDGQNVATQYLFAGGNLLDNPATARGVNPLAGIHARPGVRSLQHNLPVGAEWQVSGEQLPVSSEQLSVGDAATVETVAVPEVGEQLPDGSQQSAVSSDQLPVNNAPEAVATLHLPVISSNQSAVTSDHSAADTQSPNLQSPISNSPNPQSPRAAATNVTADITTDTTFTAAGSPYRLLNDVTIAAGAILTVETGVVVKGVVVGQTVPTLFVEGQLRADGAIFSSDTEPTAGSAWGGIVIRNGGRADLNNTQVKFGGRATVSADREAAVGVIDATLVMTDSTIFDSINFNSVMEGCLYVENSSVRLTNVLLDLCGSGISGANSQAALVLTGAATSFQASGVTVQNTTGYVAAAEAHLFNQLAGVTFQNNNKSRFFLLGSTLTGDRTISPTGGVGVIDYRGDRTIAAGATITLTAGVQMQGEANSDEWIVLGKLVTRGSVSSPVVFTSQADGGTLNSGSEWGGILVNGGSADLEHTIIRFGGNVTAGAEKAALAVIDGNLRLINSTLTRNGDRSAVNDSFVYIQDSVALIDGSTLTDDGLNGANPTFGISVIETSARAGAATSFTLRNSEVVHPRRPLRLAHKHLAGVGQGVRFDTQFDQRIFLTDRSLDSPTNLAPVGNLGNYEFDLDLTVRGDLTMQPGTALLNNGDALIIDGGSLRAIGTEDAPIRFAGLQLGGVRQWDGIALRNGGAAELDRVEISDAFRGVHSNGGSLSVRNSRFTGNTVGVRVDGAVPGFFARFNEFSGNSTAGLENGSTTTVDARLNFWGAANGPTHPSNAGGTGDKISGGDKVIFQPFLSTPVTSGAGDGGAESRTAHDNTFLTFDEADSTFTRHYPDGRAVHFNADGTHDFTQDPTGNRLGYTYNPDGSTASVRFTAAGRPSADWVWSFSYQSTVNSNQLAVTSRGIDRSLITDVLVTDPAGRTTTLTVDDLGRLVALQEPGLSAAMQFSYDRQGNMTHKRDARGFVTRYEYDAFGRIERALLPPREVFDPETGQFRQEQEIHTLANADSGGLLGGGLLNAIDPGNPAAPTAPLITSDQIVSQYAFGTESFSVRTNSFGALTGMTDALGRTTGFDRDGRDRLTKQTTPEGNCVLFAYDENDNVLSETRMDRTACEGNLAAGLVQTTTFTYEARFNRLKTMTDPLGNTTTYVYDYEENSGQAGLKVRHIFPAVQDENGQNVTPEERYVYNGQGQMTELIDRRGNKTCFVYTTGAASEAGTIFADGVTPVPGLLTQTVGDCGGPLERRTVYRNFDAAGNAQVKEEPFGVAGGRLQVATRTTQMRFDTRNRLVESTDPLGGVNRLAYDNGDNPVQAVVDATGRPLTMTASYNPIGQALRRVTEAEGDRIETRFGYSINRQQTMEQDGRGNITRFHYDAVGQLVKITDALGNAATYQYDGDGRLTRMTDAKGTVTSYTYDGLGRVLTQSEDVGGLNLLTTFSYDLNNNLLTATDPKGVLNCFAYDADNRTVSAIADCGGLNATRLTGYDRNGNLARMTDPLGRVTRMEYDTLDRLVKIIDAAGGETRFAYDAADNLIRQTDELGNASSFTYDERDRLLTTTDALGNSSTFTYDSRNNPMTVTDPLGRTTQMASDGLGRPVQATDPLGGVSRMRYDSGGNVIGLVDPLGRESRLEYDALDRLARTVDPLGQIGSLGYDRVGNVTALTDPLGQQVKLAYDPVNRLVEITDAAGHKATTLYDAAGNVTSTTDPLGRTESFAYDNLYRPVSNTDAKGDVTGAAFDLAGNRLSITDPGGNTTTFTYDALDRMVSETNGSGQSRTFTYDAGTNLTRITDRNGRVRQLAYDALHRVVEEKWVDGNYTATYSRDAAGQLTQAGDPNGSYTMQYDANGRLVDLDQSLSLAPRATTDTDFRYAYDAVGNLVQTVERLNGSSRAVTGAAFDKLNRTVRLTQQGAGVAPKRADIAYDALSRITRITRFGDLAGSRQTVASDYRYDARSLLTRIQHLTGPAVGAAGSDAAAATRTYEYIYDAAARLTRMTLPDGTSLYSYDNFDQLTGADHSFQPDESYSYDANGNRTGGGHQTGSDNRLLNDGTFRYEYDGEGNRTKRIHNSTNASTEYTWDFRNRLTKVVEKNGSGQTTGTVEYVYDVFNQRILRAEGGSSRQYAVSNGHTALELVNGAVTHRYLHGPVVDLVLADEQPEGVLYPLADHQLSVRDLADASGQIVDHRLYDSFGRLVSRTNPAIDHPFAYTGREMEDGAGLHYYRNRYYDAAVGRFISEDPLGFAAGDTNLSRYVGNGAVGRSDPSGLREGVFPATSDEAIAKARVGAGIGLFAGFAVAAQSIFVDVAWLGVLTNASLLAAFSAFATTALLTFVVVSAAYLAARFLEDQFANSNLAEMTRVLAQLEREEAAEREAVRKHNEEVARIKKERAEAKAKEMEERKEEFKRAQEGEKRRKELEKALIEEARGREERLRKNRGKFEEAMRQHQLKLMEFPLQFNDQGQVLTPDNNSPEAIAKLIEGASEERLKELAKEGVIELRQLMDESIRRRKKAEADERKKQQGGGGLGNAIQPEPGKGPLSAVNVANQNRPADISIPLNVPARNKHGQIITPGTSDSGGGGSKDACFPNEGKQ